MTSAALCSTASLAVGESLAATATQGADWLLVEVRGAWGRDAIADSELAPALRGALEAFAGKAILVRRPDRRSGATVIHATVTEGGGSATRREFESLAAIPWDDLGPGEPCRGPIVLVCAHGRRDACCARLGTPFFDAVSTLVASELLWQSSHLGGHRFAPNVLSLPQGVQLGRIPVERAAEVVELLADGRIPLDLYRGRTIYPPPVQAAEQTVRMATGYDVLTDLRLVSHEQDVVTFQTPGGELRVRVEERAGASLPVSCGVEPEQTAQWVASVESVT